MNANNNVPQVQVGIMSDESEVRVTLNGTYGIWGTYEGKTLHNDSWDTSGRFAVVLGADGKLNFDVDVFSAWKWDTLTFLPKDDDCSFTLHNVTIGVSFHWRRQENQTFKGALKLIQDNGRVVAINVIDVESYLESVISSEMSANASLELLKAHAVISRSWLLAQMRKPAPADGGQDVLGEAAPVVRAAAASDDDGSDDDDGGSGADGAAR